MANLFRCGGGAAGAKSIIIPQIQMTANVRGGSASQRENDNWLELRVPNEVKKISIENCYAGNDTPEIFVYGKYSGSTSEETLIGGVRKVRDLDLNNYSDVKIVCGKAFTLNSAIGVSMSVTLTNIELTF